MNSDKFKLLFQFAPTPILCLRKNSQISDINLRGSKLIFAKRHLEINKYFTEFIDQESLPIFNKFIKDVFEGHTEVDCEVRLNTVLASNFYFKINGSLLPHSNECILTFEDITNFKYKKKALDESLRDLNEANKIAKIGRWSLDFLVNKLYWSESTFEIFQIDPIHFDASYEYFLNSIHPDDRNKVDEAYQLSLKNKEPYSIEHRLIMRDGTIKWVKEVCRSYFNEDGVPRRSTGIIQDITESKKLQNQLNRALNEYRSLCEDTGVLISTFLPDGTLTYVNSSLAKLVGALPNELIGSNVYTYLNLAEASKIKKDLSLLTVENPVSTREQKFYSENGIVSYQLWTNRAFFDESNQITYYQGIGQDITSFKTIENQLFQSHTELIERQIAINEHAIIAFTDIKGRITYANKMFCDISQYSLEELIGKDHKIINSGFHSPDFFKTLYKTIQSGDIWHGEIRNKAKDGSFYWVATTISPLRNFKGEIEQYLAIRTDITQRVLAEEKIKNLLLEKEILLVEVHHRIKNNMNTIFSLLKIQANSQEGSREKNILLDAAGRIQSMMVLYDKLYKSDSNRNLSIQAYIPTLLKEIINIFPKGRNIEVQTDLENIILNATTLSPLGILLNELVTNTLKHSLSEKENGKIFITAINKENRIIFTYFDNGLRIPENISLENTTGFGLKLVNLLVRQIHGTIRIDRKEGNLFIIEFDFK